MTIALAPPSDLLGTLRGTPALRPAVDRGLAGGLRAWLEDGVFERLGASRRDRDAILLGVREVAGAPVLASSTALLRAALVGQLVRLKVAGAPVVDPFDDAACALSASGRHEDLVSFLVDLDAEEHARTHAEVAAHAAVLDACIPTIPRRWSPRCGVRQAVPLAGGAVQLRGRADVALGEPGSTRACVCLLQVTTSRLGPRHDAVLDYLALLETLRSGETPLRVACLSTSDGTFVVHDVTSELLARAVAETLRALDAECAA